MEEFSSFERRVQTKPWVVIDSSIILAAGAPGFSRQIQCMRYLNKSNKEYQAYITKPIMGELLKELSEMKDINLAMSAFEFIRNMIIKFKYIPHMHLDQDCINTLRNHFSIIHPDDRLHIAHVYTANKKWAREKEAPGDIRFATIDNKIVQPDTIRYLKLRLGVEIINPSSLFL